MLLDLIFLTLIAERRRLEFGEPCSGVACFGVIDLLSGSILSDIEGSTLRARMFDIRSLLLVGIFPSSDFFSAIAPIKLLVAFLSPSDFLFAIAPIKSPESVLSPFDFLFEMAPIKSFVFFLSPSDFLFPIAPIKSFVFKSPTDFLLPIAPIKSFELFKPPTDFRLGVFGLISTTGLFSNPATRKPVSGSKRPIWSLYAAARTSFFARVPLSRFFVSSLSFSKQFCLHCSFSPLRSFSNLSGTTAHTA
mmetsp:Transcript_36691/g.49636  ORF Transcript_36691/g.49636 Transcript_36691/m.49636 type:complete len:248 (-) Transcript_36691:1222-1965(-)